MSTPPCLGGEVPADDAGPRRGADANREKEQARWIIEVWTYLNEAKRFLAEKGSNADIFEAILQADENLSRFLIILLGINPENEGDPGRVAWWDGLSRDEHLDLIPGGAWFYHHRALGAIEEALRRAAGHKRAAPALTALQNAQGTLALLDNKLWRVRPPDFPTIGRPGIGHGSVNLVGKRIYQALVYGRRWFLGVDAEKFIFPPWLPAYRRRVTDELRMQLSQYIRITNTYMYAIGFYCDLYEIPVRRECRVMEALRMPLMEASEAFHFMAGGDPWTDFWRTGIDWAAWAALDLPSCRERAERASPPADLPEPPEDEVTPLEDVG